MKTLVAVVALSVAAVAAHAQTTFTVVNNGATAYRINGVDNPTLALNRGTTYTFNVNATGHPFYVKTVRVTGSGSQYTSGVTGQGVTVGTLTFAVPLNAPNTLFYQCGVHGSMGGTLNISGPVGVPEGELPQFVWLGPPTPNPAHSGALFKFGLPRGSLVELGLFDARGRKARDLMRGNLPAGEHAVRWDGRDRAGRTVPRGLYYYRLRVEGRTLSRSIVVR